MSTVDVSTDNASVCGDDMTFDTATGKCKVAASVCDSDTTEWINNRCMSTVDVSTDNASVCGDDMTFDTATGKCKVAASVCGANTKYNTTMQQCEKDGCAIM